MKNRSRFSRISLVLSILVIFVSSQYSGASEVNLSVTAKSIDAKPLNPLPLGRSAGFEITIKNNGDNKISIGNDIMVLYDNHNKLEICAVLYGPDYKGKKLNSICYAMRARMLFSHNVGSEQQELIVGPWGNWVKFGTKDYKGEWPRTVTPRGVATLKETTYWFSKTTMTPQSLITPGFQPEGKAGAARYYVKIDDKTPGRKILLDAESLQGLIKNNQELLALRCCAVRWLLEAGPEGEPFSLALLRDNAVDPEIRLSAVRGLMVFGSAKAIKQIGEDWEKQRLAPDVSKDLADTLTWSELPEAKPLIEKIKSTKK